MDTPASLLERLRRPANPEAWSRFVELYTPLLYYWARRVECQETEAADLVQEVLMLLVDKLPQFNYDEHKSFRGWLRTVAHNRWRNLQRRAKLPANGQGVELAEVAAPAEDFFWDTEYQQHLVSRALTLMQVQFQPATWRAFWECVVSGRPAAEVGQELGISTAAVYVAKSRVLSRLRQELAGLLD